MTIGDCLVIETTNGRFNVFKIAADGSYGSVREDISDIHAAWKIARARLEPDGREVFYKHESEPDSAIRPYVPN